MLSFNVQHDCVHSKCKPDMVRVRQERTLTDRTELDAPTAFMARNRW
jgi:hypothetical protein